MRTQKESIALILALATKSLEDGRGERLALEKIAGIVREDFMRPVPSVVVETRG